MIDEFGGVIVEQSNSAEKPLVDQFGGIIQKPKALPQKLNSTIESDRSQPWNVGVPKGTIMQHPFESAWELLNTPIIKVEPTKEAVQQAQTGTTLDKAALGVRTAADDFLSSFTSPLGAGTLGLATLPKLGRLLTTAFALQAGKQAAVDVPKELGTELGKNKQDRDVGKIAQLATSEALNAPLTGVMGAEVTSPLFKPTPPSDVARPLLQLTPEQVGKLRERNFQAQQQANAQEVAPAIRLMPDEKGNAKIITGQPGQTHDQLIDEHNLNAKQIDSRGFVGANQQWLTREQAEAITGLPTQTEQGRLHSTDLPEYKQIPPKPKTPEKELQGQDIVSTGAYVVRNLQLDPANKAVSREQIYNTLKNATTKGELTPLEFDLMDKAGLKEKLAENPTREELAKWVQEKMPVQSEVKQAPSKPTKELPAQAKLLGLDKPSTMGDVLRRIQSDPDLFTKESAQFAKFLTENFGHILDFAGVELGKAPGAKRAAYQFDTHRAFLDVHDTGAHDLVYTALHEGAHAALHWLVEHPNTPEQKAAARDLTMVREHMIDSLPARVKRFYNEVLAPAMLRKPNMSYEEEQNLFEAHGLNIETWHEPLYFLQDNSEFAAGIFTPGSEFRTMLNETPFDKGTIWSKIVDVVRKIFGIKEGSSLDHAFNSVLRLGEAARNVDELPNSLQAAHDYYDYIHGNTKQMPQMPSEKNKPNGEDVIWVADQVFTDPGKSKWGDWWNQKLNQVAGWSAAKTMALSRDAGNALVRYASARIAAPEIAKSLASQVAGERWNDKSWLDKLGAVLTEDRLRAIRQSYIDNEQIDEALNVKHVWDTPNAPIKNDAEFKAALKDPEIKGAIERFKKLIEEPVTQRHIDLGGKLARSGPESKAFVNLIAMHEGLPVSQTFFGGARQGDITNPLQRGSVFNKQAKGTAEAYNFNFRDIAERMVKGNYEEFTKQEMYKEFVKAGLAEAVKAGDNIPPTIGGKATQKITIDKGRGKGQINLWVRNDVAPELRQALQTDSPVSKGARQWVIDRLTDAQLLGPVDVTVHTRNMFSAIAGSQGGESALRDIARKVPGVRGLDTIVRVAKSYKDILADTPEVQKELAEIAKIGAGRGKVEHPGLVGKVLPTGRIVQALDKASRLTLSRMYDNLVQRELVKNTEEGRREFINRMGQYNTRLMGKVEQLLKQTSVSPFIVAGKNFNRLALSRLLLNPGVEAANSQAARKMRVIEAVGTLGTLLALPMVLNYYTTGKIWGRPGVAAGAIDTGKDDKNGKPIQIDLVQNVLVRRGLNISGVTAMYKDLSQDRAMKDIISDAFLDMARGYANPYEGPAVKFATTLMTGHDTGGYLVSDNPHDVLGANLMAALKQSNPSVAKWFQAKEEGTSKTLGAAQPLLQATGVGTGRKPSLFEREREIPGIASQSLSQRAKTQKSLIATEKATMSPRQKLMMEESAAERNHQVQQEISHNLPQGTQTWLEKQGLSVPGFAEYLTTTGTKVYLMPNERREYMKIMVEEYQKAVEKAKPFVERQSDPVMKKKVLDTYIKQAHGIARNRMKNEIGKIQ